MKTLRKSRSTQNRNTSKEIAARGRSRTAAEAMLPPVRFEADGHTRRASRGLEFDATPLHDTALSPNGVLTRPNVTVITDAYTRIILGWHVS